MSLEPSGNPSQSQQTVWNQNEGLQLNSADGGGFRLQVGLASKTEQPPTLSPATARLLCRASESLPLHGGGPVAGPSS